MVKIKEEKVLIRPEDIKPSSKRVKVLGVLNPATARLPNGDILMYVRVIEKLKITKDKNYFYVPRMIGKKEFKMKIDRIKRDQVAEHSGLDILFHDGTKRLTFISHFRRVILDKSGLKIKSISKRPNFYGIRTDGELGVEDPRITKVEDKYVMTYVSLSISQNIATAIAISKSATRWERKGIIFGEQDKDVVIFPEKVKGKYVAFDRPEGNFRFSNPHIWIAFSDDLLHWGNLKAIPCVYEENGACYRNGAGPPPIKTKKGWLLLYHSVKEKRNTNTRLFKVVKDYFVEKEPDPEVIAEYSAGAALFHLKKPERLIARTKELIIKPNPKFDNGIFEDKSVVFPTGIVKDINGKDLLIYSGGGDVLTTVRKISLSSIMKSLHKV